MERTTRDMSLSFTPKLLTTLYAGADASTKNRIALIKLLTIRESIYKTDIIFFPKLLNTNPYFLIWFR